MRDCGLLDFGDECSALVAETPQRVHERAASII
jgi:hypothetical protein